MNEQLRHPFPPPRKLATTQAADGYPRRAWTADDVQKMMEAGILEHGERLELIGGELVAMASKGILHERVKLALCEYWYDHRPKHFVAPFRSAGLEANGPGYIPERRMDEINAVVKNVAPFA